jgi:hypothetical protein
MNGACQAADHNQNNEIQKEEYIALRSILGKITTKDFFEDIWQEQAVVFSFSGEGRPSASVGVDGSWNDKQMKESPLGEIVHQMWHVLTCLLHQ